MSAHPRPIARALRDEHGGALIMVVAIGAILSLLMTLLVVTAVSGTRQATSDANWNAALAAAYAGIDEYQSRLSVDTSYYRFGNPASPFSSAGNVTLPDEPDDNPAFGVDTGGEWATVEGSGDRAEFRYEVDNSQYITSGRIRLRSTGKVGDATRTVVADLKQQGFIDFLYFTDYEVQDPDIAGTTNASCFSDTAKTTLKYSWGGRPVGATCNEIAFGAFDVSNGPVHTNDTLRACGSVFTGTVTTAKTTSPYYSAMNSNGASCATPTFTLSGYPAYSGGVIGMPATNSELKKETRTDLGDDVPRPGCLYTGPTQITFNSNGTMTVKSPFTKATRIGDANSTVSNSSAPAACGAIADLRSTAGATITVPDNNVVYVQNVPAVTTDVNYWPTSGAGSTPTNFTCTTNSGWTFGTGTNPPGYPVKTSNTSTTEVPPTTSTYGCRAGDVFVRGQFDGALTVAAENYVFVVGNITYVDEQDDMLGLVGNNAVWVYNPVNSSNALLDTSQNRTIHAAILSVAHTFQVQNFNKGVSRGTLNVMGAIAQKYRGTVATASGSSGAIATGFAKNYVYDVRFKYKAPPKFLNPVTTTYGVTTWVETSAVWAANGAAR